MNFIAQVEEHLRDLGAEARKNHPGVKEASERAILQLRTLQNAYVTAVRQATKTGGPHPTTALFQSQDLLRPFLLAANYPNASLKLLEISFKAMRLLIEGHAICPGDGIHLVRVWTIQAQVCASQHKSSHPLHFYSAPAASATPANSSSSSWFGGFSLTGGGNSNTAAGSGSEVGVVSSSSGQGGHHNKKEHDRLAVEILACLVMLLELRELPVSEEQWSGSVSLCCILLSVGDASSTTILPQAAKSTLRGVLSLLFERSGTSPVAIATWMDLLNLATLKKPSEVALKGAFSACSLKKGPLPPPPELCLELLHEILTQRPDLLFEKGSGDAFLATAGKLKELLRTTQIFGILHHSMQLTGTLIHTQHEEWKPACRELLLELVSALCVATEACRNHDDFEDGYIYIADEAVDNTKDVRGNRRGSNTTVTTTPLVPAKVLWKAALALEIIHKLLSDHEDVILEEDGTLVAVVTEAVSDFATIAASCKETMLQVADCAKEFGSTNPNDTIEPTMFRRAEEGGKALGTGASAEAVKSKQVKISGGGASSSASTSFPPCEIGEPVWIAFHCILQVCRTLKELMEEGDGDNDETEDNSVVVAYLMEGSFAPSLAGLQHYLKRFPGSCAISKFALAGYANLADVALAHGTAPQRKALVSSLCKLSLPMWGKYDSSSQLQDHHTRALLCLLGVVHNNYDTILSEWTVVIWTLEELSTLSISSPQLSESGYRAALDVSRTYARIAPLSACLSVESLRCLIDALADASKSSLKKTNEGIQDRDYVVPMVEVQPPPVVSRSESLTDPRNERRGSKDFEDGNPSIGGKLMNFAGRAISAGLGTPAADGSTEEPSDVKSIPLDQRTKKNYHDDYRNDFAKRMGGSKGTTSNEVFSQIPFALMALTDVAMSNSFRFESCFALVSQYFCLLAGLSTLTRVYTMDTIAMLITSQVSEEGSMPSRSLGPCVIVEEFLDARDFWVVKEVDLDTTDITHRENSQQSKSISHKSLLEPLCECIRTTERADIAEAAISALHSILEGVGHNLKVEAWIVVIDAVSSLSGDATIYSNPFTNRSGPEFSACGMLAFRCLKLIVDDYLTLLPPSSASSPKGARAALLDCCSSFGSSRHDVNTSLTAIGFLWTIADQDPDLDPKSLDHALSRLVHLSSDGRAEVRNCSVNTLFSFVAGRGQQFSSEQWKAIITETIFDIFDHVATRGEVDDGRGSPRREGIDQSGSRYKVSVHHSRNSEMKQWATTQVMALRGLSRVLRNFFQQLLATVENGDSLGDEVKQVPWFPTAWNRILDVALDSATQLGGRETLELRKAGVDLLILCAQLSSRAGIGAAMTPARVGTHMEVVNGALRSVRDSNAKTREKEKNEPSISKATSYWREKVFRESFKMLVKLGHHFDNNDVVDVEDDKSVYIESAEVQVMQSLSVGLGKLYDCCKDEELSPISRSQGDLTDAAIDEEFEDRFVSLLTTVAKKAVGDPGSKFLTQAQRASFDVLRTMTSNASPAALKVLAMLAGRSFIWVSNKDEQGDADLCVLGHEAAEVVAEEMGNEKLSNESKTEVLQSVLSIFIQEHDEGISDGVISKQRRRCYDLFVPVMQGGLQAATLMEEEERKEKQMNDLWEMVLRVLRIMLTKVQIENSCLRTPLTKNVLDFLSAARSSVPGRQIHGLCAVLLLGASNSLDILIESSENDGVATSDQTLSSEYLANVLNLYEQCFTLAGDLDPLSTELSSIAERSLQYTVNFIDSDKDGEQTDHGVKIALVVCKAIQNFRHRPSLVAAVFPLLCKLTGADNGGLRKEVGTVLAGIDLPQILAKTEERARTAEERAFAAQKHIEALESQVVSLREENEALHQKVAVLSANLPYI